MPHIEDWFWQDLPATGSTNDDAISHSATAQHKKFVITAQRQHKGRGRRGRNWIGMDGNLFMSLGIESPLAELGELVFVVSLSLAQSIKTIAPHHNIQLKWPNDVLIDGAKISGILLEKGTGDYLIIGIGVNVTAAPELECLIYPAASLATKGIRIDRIELLRLFLSEFDRQLVIWREQGFMPIKQQWLDLACGLGSEIKVVQEQTEKRGIFSGVDDNGLLLLDMDGKIVKIYAGDVFFNKGKE